MTHEIGSTVDIAGTAWTIAERRNNNLIIEHANGNRVQVPEELLGIPEERVQVGDVWLFVPEMGGDVYPRGHVQVIGTQDTFGRWPVVYVADRHPREAKIGRVYALPEELVERAEVQVATVAALADGEQELLNGSAPEPGFTPKRVYLFTQQEQAYTGAFPTGRVIRTGVVSGDWIQVRYVNAMTNNGGAFWARQRELSEG
jgi:hypothetical protein